jgi:hypothetical protein
MFFSIQILGSPINCAIERRALRLAAEVSPTESYIRHLRASTKTESGTRQRRLSVYTALLFHLHLLLLHVIIPGPMSKSLDCFDFQFHTEDVLVST